MGGVRRHRTGTEHRVNSTVHSGRNKYLKRSGKYGKSSEHDLVLAFSDVLNSAVQKYLRVLDNRTVLLVMSSWRLYYKLLYRRLKNELEMLTCCRRKKDCTLSHLKTQYSSLLNSQALNVVTKTDTVWSSLGHMCARHIAPHLGHLGQRDDNFSRNFPQLSALTLVSLSPNAEHNCHFISFCASLANTKYCM